MSESIVFTAEQKALYRETFAPSATDGQWQYFIGECERRGLVPGVHAIFKVKQDTEYNKELQREVNVEKVVLITTINALRLIALRSGLFTGYGKFVYHYMDEGTLSQSEIPLGKKPHAVSVELYREGWGRPVLSVARYAACIQPNSKMWDIRAEEQTAKCAEANGLRMVAPEECGGLYTTDEMGGDESPLKTAGRAPEPAAAVPAPTVAPAVNQAPAEFKRGETITVGPALPGVPILPFAQTPVTNTPSLPAPAVGPMIQSQPPAPVTSAPKPPAPPAPRPAAPPAPPKPPAGPSAPVPPTAIGPTGPTGPVTPLIAFPAEQLGPAHETHSEIAAVADRVARDKDPVSGTAVAAAILAPAPVTKPFTVSDSAPVVTLVAQHAVIPATDAATADEYKKFLDRSAKIVRDKLERDAKLRGAGNFVKDYLLKRSGKKSLKDISAATFETLILALETAPAEHAAKIVQEK